MIDTVRRVLGCANKYGRDSWLAEKLASISRDAEVLDAGAGECRNRKFCGHLRYTSQDVCQYDGSGTADSLQTGEWDTTQIDIVSDICSIPVADETFDVALCTEVLEHLTDPQAAVFELQRTLKPGGELILTAPFVSLTHFAPYHFCSGFNRYWYENVARTAMLEVEEIVPNGNFYGVLSQELIRLTTIPHTGVSRVFRYLTFLFTLPVLLMLALASRMDRGKSSHLMCFGYHVVLRKL